MNFSTTMKFLLGVFCLIAIIVVSNNEIIEDVQSNNIIEVGHKIINILKGLTSIFDYWGWFSYCNTSNADKFIEIILNYTLEFGKKYLESRESISLRTSYEFYYQASKLFKINCSFTNVTVYHPSKYEVRLLKSHFPERSLDFEIYFPILNTTNTYGIFNGSSMSMTFVKKGYVNFNITNLKVKGNVTYEVKDHLLKIQKLNISYNFTDLQVNTTINERSSKIDWNKYISWAIRSYLTKEKKYVAEHVSKKIVKKVNTKIKSFHIDDIIKTILSIFSMISHFLFI